MSEISLFFSGQYGSTQVVLRKLELPFKLKAFLEKKRAAQKWSKNAGGAKSDLCSRPGDFPDFP
jgi:hypothetical protein